jgi:catechol-2,3-dioxygenase
MAVPLNRLNHAVLYVRDVNASLAFYQSVFEFDVVARMGEMAVFLRARAGTNHHDLALMSVGAEAPQPPRGATGLYHLAWEVPSIDELARARQTLVELGALVGQSDHGVSKSLYARDPDGIEFEVMWSVPPEHWGAYEREAVVKPLRLEEEIARWGAATAR